MGKIFRAIMDKHKVKLLIFGVGITAVLTLIAIYNDTIRLDKVDISSLKIEGKAKHSNPLYRCDVIITTLHMGIGNDNSLAMTIASPYSTEKQRSQLRKNSVQIKNDFLLDTEEEKLKEWVEKRDFAKIKSKFRGIVNKYLDEPVQEVYISTFFYK